MNTQTPHPHKDLYINHKLTSEEGRYPLTLLDRYHLIGCYWQTSIFGLIANLFVPLIAAAGKLRAEGHSEITDLSVHGWSIDREVCWFIAAILGLASLLKVFQLVREQFPGVVGLVTTFILCCGAEQQWIIFKPTWNLNGASFFDLCVTGAVFLFILAANAFAGASNLAIKQRKSDLDCLLTLDDNVVTRAALLKARDQVYRAYFQRLESILLNGASENGKSKLKVFRVVHGDHETHWIGPAGDALLIELIDPNILTEYLGPIPKNSLADAKSSQLGYPTNPNGGVPPTVSSQISKVERPDDPNQVATGGDDVPIVAPGAGIKNNRKRV